MSDLLYSWGRCSHVGIGQPGCPVCDPSKSRCVARAYVRAAQLVEEYAIYKRENPSSLSTESLDRLALVLRGYAKGAA